MKFLGEFSKEPALIHEKVEFLNKKRDIENARDFFQTDQGTAKSLDPRLIDPIRNIHMELDRPPLQPRNVQPLRYIYEDCDNNIRPKVYQGGYSSLYPGDYLYYVDSGQSLVYGKPTYVVDSALIPYLYQDPMGALHPMYDRVPLYENKNNLSDYSHDRDQMSFREDIMSRQSRLIDRSDYQMYVGHFRQNKTGQYDQQRPYMN